VVQIHSPRPSFVESATFNFSNSRKSTMSTWYETKRSYRVSVGRERSLSFEFIALRQEFCFTGNPILGKLSTRSALWEEKQKSNSRSALRKTRSCYCVDCGQSPDLTQDDAVRSVAQTCVAGREEAVRKRYREAPGSPSLLHLARREWSHGAHSRSAGENGAGIRP
jgi:hypothetical protein